MVKTRIWQCVGVLLIGLTTLSVHAKPYPVTSDVSIRHGNWYPLPIQDMKAAATDTALDVISDGGLLKIVKPGPAAVVQGNIRLEISLIGPAETAKLTIKLDLIDNPSFIATSSISVRNLDYQGIYKAFEHIGRTAGERMNDKVQALLIEARPQIALQGEAQREGEDEADNPEIRSLYDQAQLEKRNFHYKKARILFEQVAAATGPGSARLSKLAKDELIYGLPVFEAKQWIVAMGQALNTPKQINEAQVNAMNLFRQILAENSHSFERTQEAQRYIDELSVSQRALNNAMYAGALNRVDMVRRMMQMEQVRNFTDDCPDKNTMLEIIGNLHQPVSLLSMEKDNSNVSYILQDHTSEKKFRLICQNAEVSIDKRYLGLK